MDDPDGEVRTWTLTPLRSVVLSVVSTVLLIPAFFGFGVLAVALDVLTSSPSRKATSEGLHLALLSPWGLVGTLLLTAACFLFHEWCHGLAFRRAGVTPSYGSKWVYGCFLLYATAPGKWLTRADYLRVAAAPTVLVNAAGLALMFLATPFRWSLAIALTLHLAGCFGDWWMSFNIARLPRRAFIQDRQEGYAYVVPAQRECPAAGS